MASRVAFSVDGASKVARKMQLTADAEKLLDDNTQRWGKSVRKILKRKPYPPKPPFSTYVRTGRLSNSWSARSRGLSVVAFSNSAHYSGYVVGLRQTVVHRHNRWWLARDVVNREVPRLVESSNKIIEGVWK